MRIPVFFITLIFGAVLMLPNTRQVSYQVAEAPNLVLNMPSKCEVGELVRLDARDSNVGSLIWQIVPDTDDFEADGNRAWFSGREPGEYLIIVAAATGDIPTLMIRHLEVVTVGNDLERQILKAVNNLNITDPKVRLDGLQKLQGIFNTLANSPVSVDKMLETAAQTVSDTFGEEQVIWVPLLDVIGTWLDQQLEQGNITTVEDYQRVFREISEALAQAAIT